MKRKSSAAAQRSNLGVTRRQFVSTAGLFLAAAGRAPAAFAQSRTALKTLVVGGEALGDNFDVVTQFQGWSTVWVWGAVHDRLVRSDFQKIEPMLARSWKVSEDGLTYVFQLRQGVKFHDGTPFNAEAVEFNYMRLLDKNHPHFHKTAVATGSLLAGIREVKATAEYEVTLGRDKPGAGTLAALCLFEGGIQSPAAIKKNPTGYGATPVGTGPWIFEKSAKGSQAEFRANPDYWNGKPPVDRLVIRQISDAQAMAAALRKGEVDITPFIDFKDLPSFERDPKLKVEVTPAANTGHIGINVVRPILNDVRVRKAIAHATNPQAVIAAILEGQGDLPAGYIPKAFGWAWNPDWVNYYPYDIGKAKALLKEAGHESGFPLTLLCQNTGFWPRLAELIQGQLSEVGIKVTVERLDSSRFFSVIAEGKHDCFVNDSTWSVPNPSDIFFQLMVSSSPRSKRWGWVNKEFDDLVVKQDQIQDQAQRGELIKRAQKLLLDEVPNRPLYYDRFAYVMNRSVSGFTPLPGRIAYFDKVSVS